MIITEVSKFGRISILMRLYLTVFIFSYTNTWAFICNLPCLLYYMSEIAMFLYYFIFVITRLQNCTFIRDQGIVDLGDGCIQPIKGG